MSRILKSPESEQAMHGFEMYYGLGTNRTIKAIAKNMGLSETTVKGWSRTYKWAERVIDRDRKVAEQIDRKAVGLAAARKMEYLDTVHMGMEKFKEGLATGRIKVKSVADAERLINMYTKLIGEQQVNPNTVIVIQAADIIKAEKQVRADGRTIELEAGEFVVRPGERSTTTDGDDQLN